MKIYTRILFLATLFTLSTRFVFAQLVVGSVGSAEELAASLVGSGVTISNVVLNCPDGGWGYFNGVNSNLSMDSGIVLASGDITNMVGPNLQSGITTDFQAAGDADLTAYSGNETYDACVLEFDVVATGDTLRFNYVFGSDEYTEWVNSPFNDIFAFLISGPGITGSQNIALVPASTTPVAINTVNCINGSPYYICNDPMNYECSSSYDCPTDASTTTLEYDGFTVVLTAEAIVQPCQTYHLKLAVADASDHVLDSGVFIKAGSLSAAGTTVAGASAYVDPYTGQPTIVEGCLPGFFTFTLSTPLPDSSTIHYTIGGTALNGIDYSQIQDSLVIPPGSTTGTVEINPLIDAFEEGNETVTVYLYLSCDTVPYDSATLYIADSLVAVADGDTTICIGQSAQLTSNAGGSWSWSPSIGLDCSTCQNPIATPLVTTTYTVTLTIENCTATDVVTIQVDNPIPVSAGPDGEICVGQSVQLNASNANDYTWTPSTGLSATNVPNPTATPTTTTTYIVTGVSGCFTTSDTVTVVVHPLPDVTAGPDVTVCPGTPVDVFATGGVSYSWFPPSGVNNSTSQNPTATVNETTEFTVVATDQFGCQDSAHLTITTFDIPTVTVSNDTSIYLGNSVSLLATGGVNYQWVPPTYLDANNIPSPLSTPTETTTYTVTITTADGCIIVDSVKITVIFDALVMVPSAFSPNNDNNNDLLHVLVRGIFHLNDFYIYNRWGALLFQTNDANIGWDGKYKGEPQELGVYVYLVEGTDAKGNKISKQGNITLMR